MSLADAPSILKYGALGFGLLLAVLAYRLLEREQGKTPPRPRMLWAIYVFMSFAVVLAAMGFISEALTRLALGGSLSKHVTTTLLDAHPTQTVIGDASASREEIENVLTNTVRRRLEQACFNPPPDHDVYGIVDALISQGSSGYANNVSIRDTNFSQRQQNCSIAVFRGSVFPEPPPPAGGNASSGDREYWISARITVRP